MKTYKYTIQAEVLSDSPAVQIKGAEDAARYIYEHLYRNANCWRESCWAIFVDRSNRITGHFLVSLGGTDSTTMDVKAIAKAAIDVLAYGVILCHNHPSGNPVPSAFDLRQTGRVKSGLSTLDINLLDHIIVTEKEYYSFSEERTTPRPRGSRPVAVEDLFTPEQIDMMATEFLQINGILNA